MGKVKKVKKEPDEVKVERIARNAIHEHLRMERVEGDYGIIYFAHGLSADGTIVGVWGHKGIARILEFTKDSKLDGIRQILVNDAAGLVEMHEERGIHV